LLAGASGNRLGYNGYLSQSANALVLQRYVTLAKSREFGKLCPPETLEGMAWTPIEFASLSRC
ncbi:MAG: hypothetical protein LC674_01285, partial [Actinobacteria bacterium]|nr:hypothetical protein [Actinomycetota bacterium]